jgi:hypothetical protein
VAKAKKGAIEVLLHNRRGPYQFLPRTAGWGYPEPYTRDLMISCLGMLASGDRRLIRTVRTVLRTAAKNQSQHGHIPSLLHAPEDRGASDTTPLFLLALAIYRRFSGEDSFLEKEGLKSLTWMDYQSPEDRVIVTQQPTSDWRDEQWVLGHGLYVNTIVYSYLQLFGHHEKARTLRGIMNRFDLPWHRKPRPAYGGLAVPHKPYYALWNYKRYNSERFDLLGNSLAILSGIASPSRAARLVHWVELECEKMGENGDLALNLPPCLFPYMRPGDADWRPLYGEYGQPGTYHNGGVWPFICGFYVAALVAAGRPRLARKKLDELTKLVRPAREHDVSFGFNEWFRAQDGSPQGQDYQTWSAAMYIYAAKCVEQGQPLFFDRIETCPANSNNR